MNRPDTKIKTKHPLRVRSGLKAGSGDIGKYPPPPMPGGPIG